jgi:hypothetical protein
MPTDRKPLHRAHRSRLDAEQEMELWLGPSHRGSAFASEADRQWAWTRHRDRLMELFARNGKRPWGWWAFETELRYPGHGREQAALYEAGLLTEVEVAELVAQWRRDFERAQGTRIQALHRASKTGQRGRALA